MQNRLDRWLLAGTAALAVSSIGCAQLKQNVVAPSPYERQLGHVLLSDKNPYYPKLQSLGAGSAAVDAPADAPRAAALAPIARVADTNVPPRRIVSTQGASGQQGSATDVASGNMRGGLGFAGDAAGFGPDTAIASETDDPTTVMVPLDAQPERPRAPKITADVGLGDPGDGTVGQALPAADATAAEPGAEGLDGQGQLALPDFDPAVELPDFTVPSAAAREPAKAAPAPTEAQPEPSSEFADEPAAPAPSVTRTPSRLDVMDEDPNDLPAGSVAAAVAPALTRVTAPSIDGHRTGSNASPRGVDARSHRPGDAAPASLGPAGDTRSLLGDGSVKGEVLAAAQRLVGVRTPFDESRFLASLLSAADLGLGDASAADGFIKAVYDDLDKQQRTFGIGTEPSPGDLVFFSNTFDRDADGRTDDWFTMAGVVESVQGNGTIVFIGVCEGEVRRMVFAPERPSAGADTRGDTLNSPLRIKSLSDRPFTKYLAGELFAAFGHLQDD